jgi:rRNA biogenesis protein RRP5
MEGVLSNYPKRVDLWNIFLDMEIKLATKLKELHAGAASRGLSKDPNVLNHEATRRLFERITSLNLSTKKMKFFFKKNLEWEKSVGADPERLERVKAKARAFVATKSHADE